MKLTNDDIVLLERLVDNCRENTGQAVARLTNYFDKVNINQKKKLDKMFEEYSKAWDGLMTLSTKLQHMRNGGKKNG